MKKATSEVSDYPRYLHKRHQQKQMPTGGNDEERPIRAQDSIDKQANDLTVAKRGLQSDALVDL